MDVSKFKIPEHWPPDAKAFSREAISEIQDLNVSMKLVLADIIGLKNALEKAEATIRNLKDKLGNNSSNSGTPPSRDPLDTPPPEPKPSGRKQGAQKGHQGSGRKPFSPDRIDRTIDVFPLYCPVSKKQLSPADLESLYWKPFQQVDLPEDIRLVVTEARLHACLCPCGCGKTLTAVMPPDLGNTAVGPRLKSMMALLASRYHLSKRLIQELLIDMFGPDATFSTGCISKAEEEVSDALKKPYQEAKEEIQKAEAVHVDETGWFLKHKIHWLWVAVSSALTVFYIDPNRSQSAFDRFLGAFEGFIISDRFAVYSKLSPEERQVCWAHLIRDFRKLVDRQGGAEGIGEWALKEIEAMFDLWHLYLDRAIDQDKLQQEFLTIRARFARLLKLGMETSDKKAGHLCENLLKIWPALWNFIKHPDILQPTNNRAEQAVRQSVIGRILSLGSQSERGLRFVERMLTVVTTLRMQGRNVLAFIQEALRSFRVGGIPPSLLPLPSG